MCSKGHWLSQCEEFKKKPLKERLDFVKKAGICDNCLTRDHIAGSCDKSSFCRVQGCQFKYSTFLHPQGKADERRKGEDKDKSSESQVSISGNNNNNQPGKPVRNGYVKSGENLQGPEESSLQVTSLVIVPVKVKALRGSKTIETYAFLDGGSNTTFCTY